MLALAAAVVVAGSVVWGAREIARAIASAGRDAARDRTLAILAAFAPAVEAAERDPRGILVWQPVARAARALFPEDFARVDQAAGSTFPFSEERVQDAHARWTTDWLAWERAHDAEFKRKAAQAQEDFDKDRSPAARARVEAVEHEKLELYQRRYEEYVRVAKALKALF